MRLYEELAREALDPKLIADQPYRQRIHPFHMVGNVYYVGEAECSSILIDTGDGLILIDTPFVTSGFLLIQSIWELGYNPSDIKLILHTHAHPDHFGCTPLLQSLFNCQTAIGKIDAFNMKEHPEKVLLDIVPRCNHEVFEPDILLEDGQVVTLGNTTIEAVWTPGHTEGLMSYFWDTEEDGIKLHCGLFGGSGINTMCSDFIEDYDIPGNIREIFLSSLDKVYNRPVDCVFGNHPYQSDTFAKQAKKQQRTEENPFIDRSEWRKHLDGIRKSFLDFCVQDPVRE